MTKHGIKPSLSKSQHTRVMRNGLDNIRGTMHGKGEWKTGIDFSCEVIFIPLVVYFITEAEGMFRS